MDKLKLILNFCEKHGFLRQTINSKTNSKHILVGPVGSILQENLRNEWLQSNITSRDVTTFFNTNDSFKNTFDYVKNTCQERIPFSIAQVKKCTNNLMIDSDMSFDPGNKYLLETYTFVSPINSMHFFYNWQRQRRMWWRKFSAVPGRYSLTDIQTNDDSQYLQINANYEWNPQIIETISLYFNSNSLLSNEQQQVKDGRKRVQSHCIKSSMCLLTALLNTLCDAYDEPTFLGTSRPMLRFHRKITPYKISFAISTSNSSISEDLNDLALFICKKLRTNNISALLLPSAFRNSLESQWMQYDELGVPYTVILNENSLKNGIVQLRNRDTTLKEQVHITDLPGYVEQLFKNY